MYYKRHDVDEETPVQFVGVYVIHWRPEWGQPTAMFAEVSDDMINTAQEMFDVLQQVEQYLVKRGIEHKGVEGRTVVLPAIRRALTNAKGEL